MRVISWNVHRCIGSDGHYRPERIVEVLASMRADVIALQEIDSSLKTPQGMDQLSFIAAELGMTAVMGPTLHRDYGAYGNAILTKHEIVACEEYDLSYRKFEPRGALVASLVASTKRSREKFRFRFINTHLGLTYWERSFQIDRMLSEIVWREEPLTILVGDFNEWFPFSGNCLRLQRSFSKCPRIATFPANWPRLALDRIFLSGSVDRVSYSVLRTALAKIASDHLPIVAEFSPEIQN